MEQREVSMPGWMKAAAALAAIVGLSLAGGLLWLKHAPRESPAGQPALAMLDDTSLQSLRAEFNRHAGETRVLVLLSPT